jgi:putative cardiolipin synthase
MGCSRIACRWFLLTCAALLCACASLPPPVERPPTNVQQALPADDRSGFRLLPYGPNSFGTRMELTRLATRTLDVQYYLLQNDNTGRAFMRALRDAAARGVRVRLLVDDLYTAGEDDLFLALASYPNVEVRLFNPFPAARGSDLTRFIASGFDFSRVNRRMHNKLFIADNAAAVTGGRNMADEYMMNIFAAGPVVRALSDEFDHYWNSPVVYPVDLIARSLLDHTRLREAFEEKTLGGDPPVANEIASGGKIEIPGAEAPSVIEPDLVQMLNTPFELARHELTPLLWANARVFYDPLTKTSGENENENSIKGTVTGTVITWLRTANKRIKLVSPYFVPTDESAASLVGARKAGLRVQIITNSLASTDEPWVYGGYWPHIRQLLAAGVEIEELSPTLSVKRHRMGVFGHRTGALHMKNAIVDDKQVFLGSMNLDQRSARLNTELGVIIDSTEMAMQLNGFADAGSWYRLRLAADGKTIQWVEDDDGKETVYDVPPETTLWQRFKLRMFGRFIPNQEL